MNDDWNKRGLETQCISSPQVHLLLLYIFDYIDEYLKGMNGDIRWGREGGARDKRGSRRVMSQARV